jgi:transcriptional repressor NrdR
MDWPTETHPSAHRAGPLRLPRHAPSRSGPVEPLVPYNVVSRSVVGGKGGGPGSVAPVRCPACSNLDDKVVDSRANDDGSSIRRRRECLACGHRFTTFERPEEQPLVVVKRSGARVPFDRAKVEAGVQAAAKGRPLDDQRVAELAAAVEDELRLVGGEIPSEQVGRAVLERLIEIDQVAYVRFASVYKDFDDPADFQREVRLLKATEPKGRPE